MKIPYDKIRPFSTNELPGVICNPALIFEFIANPSFSLVAEISTWGGQKTDWDETKRLAAELIKAVIVPTGERYELGTPEAIQELADQTESMFIVNLMNGWGARISLERMSQLKKTRPLSQLFTKTNGEPGQA
jgi:hypothetical protein